MTAPGRELAPGLYTQDQLRPGDWFATGGIKVTEAHVVGFAGLAGDFFDLHMDDEAAQALGFEGRVAHGLLILALVDGLKNRAPVKLAAIASLSWTWRFQCPVLIGDRIEARVEVEATRATSKPGRGIAELGFTVTNQAGVIVQAGCNTLMLQRRA